MEDRYEEEQVVELNLLDAELLSVRDERNDLRDRLQLLEKPGEETATETKSLEENQRKLLDEAEQERAVLGVSKRIRITAVKKYIYIFLNMCFKF